MTQPGPYGPDIVIAGAARSGTSTLAALLRSHPAIDPSVTKEPNFFSREYERGIDWYDGLFHDRRPGLLRLDASTSYTHPDAPLALTRLQEASPGVFVIYVVRDPLPRAVSHYLLRRHTLRLEPTPTFGGALRAGSSYIDVSDYPRWIGELTRIFDARQVLVVPFRAVTRPSANVVRVVCSQVGLPAPAAAAGQARSHRNEVVQFRSHALRWAAKSLRGTATYPAIRQRIGADRVRRIRSLLIRPVDLPSVEEALASCDAAQHRDLEVLERRVRNWVRDYLGRQDVRLGLDWAAFWSEEWVSTR